MVCSYGRNRGNKSNFVALTDYLEVNSISCTISSKGQFRGLERDCSKSHVLYQSQTMRADCAD